MEDLNSGVVIKRRLYNLTADALDQRRLAAKQPRHKKRAALLKIIEEVFYDTQFKQLLIRYLMRTLKKQCVECLMKTRKLKEIDDV